MSTWTRPKQAVWHNAGDWGGDVQISDASSARWQLDIGGYWLVLTRIFYLVRVDGRLAMECQTELLVCTDPADPDGTEVWSGAVYSDASLWPLNDDGVRQAAEQGVDPDTLGLVGEWPDWVWEYEADADELRAMFEFTLCEECGGDLDAHTISPDPLGKPHAWCREG